MYDGIFEDLEEVKATLSKHGYNKVDENYIFEQLERIKSVDVLVEQLLRAKSRCPDSGFQEHLEDENSLSGFPSDRSTDEAHQSQESKRTSLENQNGTSTPYTLQGAVCHSTMEQSESIADVVDLTNDYREKNRLPAFKNEVFLDLTHSESDAEIDDYYEAESWGLEGDSSDKLDSPPLLSLSQLRGMTSSPNLPNHREEQIDGLADNRVEEILEENNNDPNNNLENIHILEQNRNSVYSRESSPEVLMQKRSCSPKPGCSKDYNVAPKPSYRGNSSEISDEAAKIVELIPRLKYLSVILTLKKHEMDPNRVQEALLELLQKPALHAQASSVLMKRRQMVDNCPSSTKKVCSSTALSAEDQTVSALTPMVTDDSVDLITFANKLALKSEDIVDNSFPMHADDDNQTLIDASLVQKAFNVSTTNTNINEQSKEPAQSIIPAPAINAGTFEERAAAPEASEEPAPPVKSSTSSVSEMKTGISNEPAQSTYLTHVLNPQSSEEPAQSTYAAPVLNPQSSEEPVESKKPAHASKSGTVKKAGYGAKLKTRWEYGYREMPKSLEKAKATSYNLPTTVTDNSIVKPAKLQLPKSSSSQPSVTQTKPLLRAARLHATETKWPTKEKSLKTFKNLTTPTHDEAGRRLRPAEPELAYARGYQFLDSITPPATKTSGVLPDVKANGSVLPGAQGSSNKLTTVQTAQSSYRPDLKILDTCIARLENALHRNYCSIYSRPTIDYNPFNVSSTTHKVKSIVDKYEANSREPTTSATEAGGRSKTFSIGPEVPGTSSSSNGRATVENIEEIPELPTEKSLPREPPRELYNPLRSIFPDVDPKYIARLCIKNQNSGLEALVDKLLESRERHLIPIQPEPEPLESTVDDQFENLVGIFPNADPMYLRAFAEKNYNQPEAMKQFVQTNLENHEYPTKEDYLKKIKITEQQRQYTTEFNVQQFLNIFPNPFWHFENSERVNKYNFAASEFLKGYFNKIKVVTIAKVYTNHRYNISLAARELESIRQDMKSKRCILDVPTEDIPLLQEMAFIRNKKIIKEYIEDQKAIEEKEFNELKETNQLLECQCCFNDECMPSKCSTCSDGHVFCNMCIVTGIESKIGDGQSQFPCFTDCHGEFTLPVLQKVLKPTIFSILLQKRQEAEVMAAGLEGLVSCPFCHFASIPPPEDKIFKCFNPECMKESCRLCKELSHVPLRCDEVIKGEEARKYLEEKMTNALVRTCYKCHRPFFKEEGCNKMTCLCGACMCYICGKPVTNYNHFNAQGSERRDLCPLWSDNKRLNAQTVREVAHAAQQEIRSRNPNLAIDASALLPSIPSPSRGPHDDIPNGNMLPVHVPRPGEMIPQ